MLRRKGLLRRVLMLVQVSCVAGALPAMAHAQDAERCTVTVRSDRSIARINPNVYGHFLEHLGTAVYGGVWVGPDSAIPNIDGIRRDVVEALEKIRPPVVRWPGGCFADSYHWRDGIGPAEGRPHRINYHWGGVIETNAFGTHEFMRFVRLIGAEPFVAGNVGTGTPEEMRDWMEYLNFAGNSSLARERAKDGHPDSFGVKYLGIGNENWGCGGSMDPGHYGREFRRFSEFTHEFGRVPLSPERRDELYRVGCGPNGDDEEWTHGVFAVVSGREGRGRNRLGRMAAFDLHYYTWNRGGTYGTATDFDDEGWYGLLARGSRIEEILLRHWAIMGGYDPEHRVKLAVSEWGAWHPPAKDSPPEFLYQQNTMRDAVLAGLTLNAFNRHADKVDMANIAQTVNVLQAMILTDGPRMVVTPTFHVFEMYAPHQGAEALEVQVSEACSAPPAGDASEGLPLVSASASRSGEQVTLSLVHTHAVEPTMVEVRLPDAELASHRVLGAADLRAHNTFEDPDRVAPQPASLPAGEAAIPLPPASVSVLEYRLEGQRR
jgi:alpha-N-arabinofuranosidase